MNEVKREPVRREDNILPYGCVGVGGEAEWNRDKPNLVRREDDILPYGCVGVGSKAE